VNLLALKIKDFNTAGSGRTEPVSIGREYKCVYNIPRFEGVEVFPLIQIPEHGDAILAPRSSQRTIRRYRNGIDETGVTIVISLQLEFGQLPDLFNN